MQLPGFEYSRRNLLGTVLLNAEVLLLNDRGTYICRNSLLVSSPFEMFIWGQMAWWHPVSLLILVTLQTTEALMVHDQPPSSLYNSRAMARAKRPITLNPYTGNGALCVLTYRWVLYTTMLTIVHRPGAHVLTTGKPLQYTPTASNTTLRLTLKDENARALDSSQIYSLTVLSLADIALSSTSANGNEYIRRSGQQNSTFATSYPPSDLHFWMTATDDLPLYAVTDVLRAIQDLTHYLHFLEVVFEVFSDTASFPFASGSLALENGTQLQPAKGKGLEYINLTTVNLTSAPSRSPIPSLPPISLTEYKKLESVAVDYDDLHNPLPIHAQSFADVADRILANITDLIIANQDDGPLPLLSAGNQRLLRYVDIFGSTLGISLLPVRLLGVEFTLGQAAMALRATEKRLGNGPMVESRMRFYVDGTMIGWGCLRYTNTSTFRCILPTGGTFSSVGSGKKFSFLGRGS